jgi:hypothetical protein
MEFLNCSAVVFKFNWGGKVKGHRFSFECVIYGQYTTVYLSFVLSAYMASEVALLGLESFLHKRVT